jgi:fructose 1,6-bisphosphatase
LRKRGSGRSEIAKRLLEEPYSRRAKQMAERYVDRVHSEHAVLDIGENIGALVIYTSEALRGKEIEVSLKGNDAKRVHTAVWERRVNGRTVFAGIYPSLPAGDYIIWTTPSSEVRIIGGQVAEMDLR